MDRRHQQGNIFSCRQVFEVRKLPVGRKLIPTKLVLKIKLASNGSIDRYKARCVVAGYRQTAGLDYDPGGVYSPIAEPTTLRLVLAISSALTLNIDHLDIKTAFLNGEIPENDPDSDVGVSTPLNPYEVCLKADSPPEIDTKLRDKVWQAHSKLIHLAIWARPDLVHSVSVLGRYVHNPSKKLWSAYFSEPQTSKLCISNPMATLTPTGADLLTIENLQASISSSCSAQQSAGK